ncbi:hypothetical protein ATANTOWER_021256 [Ataeniobius toweri]|uniref:Uncharacterized protein n=1 Tax=Ataeniobius toweri TaxID=208326 RepID=A0ABU7BQU8_9TELE|nr:hypothetical protein [Ataeniobius toweri]
MSAEPKTTLSQALSVSVCGLLLPQDVQQLVEQLRSADTHTCIHNFTLAPDDFVTHLSSRCYLQQTQKESWASVTVHGFTDSPVSWGDHEHGVLTRGENFYNLLMFQDHTYRLHLATGAHDACPL